MTRLSLAIAVVALAALTASTAQAADITWNGSTDALWATPANWDGGIAPAGSLTTDVAILNVPTTNMPTLGALSVGGVNMLNAGWTLTTAGGAYFPPTIGSAILDAAGNPTIGIKSVGAGTNYLAPSATGGYWDVTGNIYVGAGNTLKITAAVWPSSYTEVYTQVGPGTVTMDIKDGHGFGQGYNAGQVQTYWVKEGRLEAAYSASYYYMSCGVTVGDTTGNPALYIATGQTGVLTDGNAGAPITINATGTVDGNGHASSVSSLIVNGGLYTDSGSGSNARITIGSSSSSYGAYVGALVMHGGTIAAAGTGDVRLNGPTVSGGGAATTSYINRALSLRGGRTGTPNVYMTHVFDFAAGTDPSGIDLAISGTVSVGNATYDNIIQKINTGTVAFNGNYNFTGDTQITAGKLLFNGAGGGVNGGNFAIANGGVMGGTGTVGLAATKAVTVAGGGHMAPGGAITPGVLTIGKSTAATDDVVTLGDASGTNANFDVRIGSAAADKLVLTLAATGNTVTSNLVLNGVNLNLSLLGGFVPTAGTSYTIIDNQAPATFLTTGTFANDTGGKVSVTGGTFDISYTGGDGNDIVLSNFAAAITLLPGDANKDGKVSFADYILLANNFGQTGATWDMGDFNGDGKVSFADYILLANNFGQHVPEPATLGLLLIGGLGLIRRNRK